MRYVVVFHRQDGNTSIRSGLDINRAMSIMLSIRKGMQSDIDNDSKDDDTIYSAKLYIMDMLDVDCDLNLFNDKLLWDCWINAIDGVSDRFYDSYITDSIYHLSEQIKMNEYYRVFYHDSSGKKRYRIVRTYEDALSFGYDMALLGYTQIEIRRY